MTAERAGMRILFFDIDGTLVDHPSGIWPIPADVMCELERLHEAGDKLIICSGRPYTMIEDELRLPIFDAYVACNGAQVMVGGQTIFLAHLDPDIAHKAADLFEDLGCEYMLETAHHIYIERRYKELHDFFASFFPDGFFTHDFDRDEVLARTMKLEAKVDADSYERVSSTIIESIGYAANVDRHGTEHALEVYSKHITKGEGVRQALAHFDASPEQAYAFGDGVNDIEMFRACGTSVAMGNADEELKRMADAITDPVWEGGLATYLRTLG